MNDPSITPAPAFSTGRRRVELGRLGFLATVAFAAATFWLAPRLPMADLAHHAGQVALWHDLLTGTSRWGSFVYVNWFTPYLLGASLALPLSFVMPVAAALKVVLTLAYLAFVAACVALRRAFGADARLDWLFIPGFFGYCFAWGFYPFLVAAPIGIVFVLVARRYAERPAPATGLVLLAVGLALFFAHALLFVFVNAIGGALLLFKRRRLMALLGVAWPYLVAGLWLVAFRLLRPPSEGEPLDGLLAGFAGFELERLNFIALSIGWPAGSTGTDWHLGALAVPMLVAPLALGSRPNRAQPGAFVPILLTVGLCLVVPFPAGWVLCQRFALFLLPFLALAFRGGPDNRLIGRIWLPVLCWTFLVVHVERLMAFAQESAPFEEVLAAAEPGYRAFSLIFDAGSDASGADNAYLHFPLWYEAEKQGLVDFNLAVLPWEVVRYRLDRVPAVFNRPNWAWRPGHRLDWELAEGKTYRYFFVRHVMALPDGFFPSGPCEPVLRKASGPWSLFENVNCLTSLDGDRSGRR